MRALFRITKLLAATLTVTLGIFVLVYLYEIGIFSISNSNFTQITNYQPKENSIIFDRHKNKIGELFSHYRIYVSYDQLPLELIDAIIAIEDRRFFGHKGIDIKGILRAIYERLKGSPTVQGGSTLTQQVVKHFLLPSEKTIERKIKEMAMALHLETILDKKKIFEIYANAMFLGNGANGVGAAAHRYFGKDLSELEPHELALIAGLFQSPSRYNPHRHPKRAKARQIDVIKALYASGKITKKLAREMIRKPLSYKSYHPLNHKLAPHFIDYIEEETRDILGKYIKNQGLRIHTTLDSKLQRMALASLKESRDLLGRAGRFVVANRPHKAKHSIEAALIATDPRNGHILAMVGGRDYTRSQFNRTIKAKRQPGSAFKPVIYSLALTRGFKWSDLLYVAPVSIDNYRPRNHSGSFLTETTMLRAFYKSINTSAIEVGYKLGIDAFLKQAKKLGITSPIRKEIGAVIGSSEVTMQDLAVMYGTFANQGVKSRPIAITKILDRKGKLLYRAPSLKRSQDRVISQQVAYLMTQGLRAVFQYGTAYKKNHMARYAAGKTGTSNASKDNWFCGYSSDLVAVVWVGSDESLPLARYATGSSLALPIWDRFMNRAIPYRKSKPIIAPKRIVSKVIHPLYGHLDRAGIKMYFIEGSEPTRDSSDLQTVSKFGKYRSIFDN